METRDLDQKVAEQFFGYPVAVREVLVFGEQGEGDHFFDKLQMRTEVFTDIEYAPGQGEWWEDLPEYSSNINDAFTIIDKFLTLGPANSFALYSDYQGLYHCEFFENDESVAEEHNASSAAEAISKASLEYAVLLKERKEFDETL